jgi:putative SOS response-associated peptidase YedK
MCGRYVLLGGKKVFATFVLLQNMKRSGQVFEELPRYNVAPFQRMPVVAVRDGSLTAEQMRWGLVPHWSKDGKVAFSTFNAKSETLDQSKLYSTYFKGSRCLIPADGFYEWKKAAVAKEVRGTTRQVIEKQPMCIRMKDESPFMFAGLFSVWKDPEGKEFPSYTIITTTPNELVGEIHDRMPVILPEKHFEEWLDRERKDTAPLKKLLLPYPAKKMKAYRVSTVVSSSRNDVPECVEPLKDSSRDNP